MSMFLLPVTSIASEVEESAPICPPDSTINGNFKMVNYSKVSITKKEVPLLSGYGISADLCGMGMAMFSKWGQYEVGAHLGVKGKYFPVLEVGLGQSNHTDERSKLHYNVHAPYFRIGLNYNLNKDLTSHNRYYVGVRYGFSAFAYDFSAPAIADDYWGGEYAVNLHNVKGNAHWGELLFGLQTQIWKFINLGWTARYRARIYEKQGAPGHAYYIPGYGKNGNSSGTFGGTFNIIFEL